MSANSHKQTFEPGIIVCLVAPKRPFGMAVNAFGEPAIDLQEKVRRSGALTLSIGSAVQIFVVAPSQAFQGFLFSLKDGEQLGETRHFERAGIARTESCTKRSMTFPGPARASSTGKVSCRPLVIRSI